MGRDYPTFGGALAFDFPADALERRHDVVVLALHERRPAG